MDAPTGTDLRAFLELGVDDGYVQQPSIVGIQQHPASGMVSPCASTVVVETMRGRGRPGTPQTRPANWDGVSGADRNERCGTGRLPSPGGEIFL